MQILHGSCFRAGMTLPQCWLTVWIVRHPATPPSCTGPVHVHVDDEWGVVVVQFSRFLVIDDYVKGQHTPSPLRRVPSEHLVVQEL